VENTPGTDRSSAAAIGGAVRSAALTRREFFLDLVDELRRTLPAPLADFQLRQTASLIKIYYGNERIHFEVWTNSARGTLEVGLHFEDGPASTEDYLAFFDDRIVEIKHQLGLPVELERWTPSWGHLYEVMPLPRLDRGVVKQTGQRLSLLISMLQPLVEQAGIPPGSVVQMRQPASGPWRGRRRRR